MLTYLTKTKLVEFLLAVNDGERQIEIIRQILCEQDSFEPYAAFKRIDRFKKGAIDAADVQKFLLDNNIHHTERECDIYIQRYDIDLDGQLIYTEFLQSVLAVDNPMLRAVTVQRPNYEVDNGQYLLYDIEYALSKVIDKEIMLYLNLDDQKQGLLNFTDFNYASAFKSIDKYLTGTINYDNLKSFFKSQSLYPTEEEIIAVLRRIDKNDDGLITFEEFVEALEPIDRVLKACANRRNASSATKFTSPTQKRNSRASSPSRNQVSPLKKPPSPAIKSTSSLRKSRPPSPMKKEASPLRKAISSTYVENSALSKEISPLPKQTSPLRKSVSPSRLDTPSERVPSSSEFGISPIDRRGLNNSRVKASPSRREASPSKRVASTEKSHNDMALIKGFSPIRKVTSPFTTQQNESFIKDTNNLSPNRNRVPESYSAKKNNMYQDFAKAQAISPTRSVERKSSIPRPRNSASRSRVETQTPEKRSPIRERESSAQKGVKKALTFDENIGNYMLIQTLKQFIILDKEVEIAKQDVVLKSDFNLLDFFRTFDVVGNGSISKKEFEGGLGRYGIYPNKEDVDLLFKKLNSNDDGLVRFSDFSETFAPKQKEYANLLHNRTPSHIDNASDPGKIFSKDSKQKIAHLLKLSLENETSSESLRQRLKKKGEMSGNEAFRYLDLKGDGFITSEELFGVFQENDSFLTEREVKILMDRLDQDKDGRVSYYELIRELTPKTNI